MFFVQFLLEIDTTQKLRYTIHNNPKYLYDFFKILATIFFMHRENCVAKSTQACVFHHPSPDISWKKCRKPLLMTPKHPKSCHIKTDGWWAMFPKSGFLFPVAREIDAVRFLYVVSTPLYLPLWFYGHVVILKQGRVNFGWMNILKNQ